MLARRTMKIDLLRPWARPWWVRRFLLPFISMFVILTSPCWLCVLAFAMLWEERDCILETLGDLTHIALYRIDYIEEVPQVESDKQEEEKK